MASPFLIHHFAANFTSVYIFGAFFVFLLKIYKSPFIVVLNIAYNEYIRNNT